MNNTNLNNNSCGGPPKMFCERFYKDPFDKGSFPSLCLVVEAVWWLRLSGDTLNITFPRSSVSSQQPCLETAFPRRFLSPKLCFGERFLQGKAASSQGCFEERLLRGDVIWSVFPI